MLHSSADKAEPTVGVEHATGDESGWWEAHRRPGLALPIVV